MPTPYENIEDDLLDGYPRARYSQTSEGQSYHYRGDYTLLSTNRPATGDIWEDGRFVSGVEFYRIGRSGLAELIVETDLQVGTTTAIATTLESTRYQCTWELNDLPLEQHPAFVPGGASDLFAAAATVSGVPARKHIDDVFGWENEPSTVLRGSFKYTSILATGQPGPEVTLTGGALAFAKFRLLGQQTVPAFLPVWSKIGTYNGTNAPGVGVIGQYTATPSGTGYPEVTTGVGYQWIKIQDDSERVGRRSRWDRSERWRGYVKVWLDIDTLNPASNTLPT